MDLEISFISSTSDRERVESKLTCAAIEGSSSLTAKNTKGVTPRAFINLSKDLSVIFLSPRSTSAI